MCWYGKLGPCAPALSGSAPALCGSVVLRILPPFPRRFCPWAPWGGAEKLILGPVVCEDAEAWGFLNLYFGPCGFRLIDRGSITRPPLQFWTPGDSSEPPFSQGLCLHPSGHVWSRRRPQQQQQSPLPCAQRLASSRQGVVGWIPCGLEACSSWTFREQWLMLSTEKFQLWFGWRMRMGYSDNWWPG